MNFVRGIVLAGLELCQQSNGKLMQPSEKNHLQNLLAGLIMVGAKFEPEDFNYLQSHCKLNHWTAIGSRRQGDNMWFDVLEWFLRLAIENQNDSARDSFLKMKNRPDINLYVGKEIIRSSKSFRCTGIDDVKQCATFCEMGAEKTHSSHRIKWVDLQTT